MIPETCETIIRSRVWAKGEAPFLSSAGQCKKRLRGCRAIIGCKKSTYESNVDLPTVSPRRRMGTVTSSAIGPYGMQVAALHGLSHVVNVRVGT